MASILYGSSLRLNECLCLRVKDIDFQYQQITVHDGKGYKNVFEKFLDQPSDHEVDHRRIQHHLTSGG